jgi:hypothetical protein
LQELRLIQRRLDFLQSWVSAHILAAHRTLPLSGLVDTLHTFQAQAAQQDSDPDSMAELHDTIDQLTVSQHSLTALLDEYNHWQRVDFNLRWINDALERDAGTLAQLWGDARSQVQPLAGDQEWAQALIRESDQLDQALVANKRAAARAHFTNYRNRVSAQLAPTLQRLKQLCTTLRQLDQEIVLLLRKIE